jgi:hypothetical protein
VTAIAHSDEVPGRLERGDEVEPVHRQDLEYGRTVSDAVPTSFLVQLWVTPR